MKDSKRDSLESSYLDGMKRLVAISKRNEEDLQYDVHNPDPSQKGKRHVCLVCGYMWEANPDKIDGPKKCPACSSVLWNNGDLKRHRCKQCSHMWMSRLEDPSKCPKCSTKLWNKEVGRYTCRDCGNLKAYVLERGPPKKCPECGSGRLSPGAVEGICKRCGYNGLMDMRRVNRCPICKTTLSKLESTEGYTEEPRSDISRYKPPRITPSVAAVLDSDNNDIRKMFELTNANGLDFQDAEILIRYRNGEDRVSIARHTDVSLNRVIMMVGSLHCGSGGRGG